MKSWPFDAKIVSWGDDGLPVYDRSYTADELRSVFGRIITNGVFMDVSSAFTVSANNGMTVTVTPGDCIINGTYGWEESQRALELTAASSKDRIDTVVLRWNNMVEQRKIDLYVVSGVASDSPVRPTLTRNELVYELGICDIFIPKNTTSVANERITDTRLETARCGEALPFAGFDTTSFYEYVNNSLRGMQAELKEQTDTAVELAQSALDGTTAGHLQNQIDGKVSKSGDTMTGNLYLSHDYESGTNQKLEFHNNDNEDTPFIAFKKNGTQLNYLQFTESETRLRRPLTIASGGTGASDAANARQNLGSLGGELRQNYWGVVPPDANISTWLRTPVNGLLPYQSTDNVSAIGSGGDWAFAAAHINKMYPLKSTNYISDFVIAQGAGTVVSNQYAKWWKFNSGLTIAILCAVGLTLNGLYTTQALRFPYKIYDPFITAGVEVPGVPNCFAGYIGRETASNDQIYVYINRTSGSGTVTGCRAYAVVAGSWK